MASYTSSYGEGEALERASIKSLPMRGLEPKGTSHGRKSFGPPGNNTGSGERVSDIMLHNHDKKMRRSSANSAGSNKSGSNCDASTRSFKPKSKMVPITIKNSVKPVESPKKAPLFTRKEPMPSLNYQRSKSARPVRKNLI